MHDIFTWHEFDQTRNFKRYIFVEMVIKIYKFLADDIWLPLNFYNFREKELLAASHRK